MADTTMLDNRINKQIKFEPLEAIVAATEEESVLLAENTGGNSFTSIVTRAEYSKIR